MAKRILSLLLAVLICIALCSAVFADDPGFWSEDYYRAIDRTGELSEAERNSLDEGFLAIMKRFSIDIAVIAVSDEDLQEDEISLEALAELVYEDYGYGYGRGADGVMIAYNTDTAEVAVERFGSANEIVSDHLVEFLCESIPEYREDFGIWGVMYAAGSLFEYGLECYYGVEDDEDNTTIDGKDLDNHESQARVGEGAEMPAWYPVNPSEFKAYYDFKASRVVDTADILTDEEEEWLRNGIETASAESGKDIVIFTDISTYGLDRSVYAADFYDFNGYGFGEEHEGVCLMVCMDPSDRGWWCCCTGSDTMSLYTEDYANEIDDNLYDYMVAGEYFKGFANWIYHMQNLFVKGMPFAPDWYPARGEVTSRFHDTDALRIVDDAGLLSEEQIADLAVRAKKLSDQYGIDIVLHTSLSTYHMGSIEYGEAFYNNNGYGFGDNYDGLLLTYFNSLEEGKLYTSGKASGLLSDIQYDRLVSQSGSDSAYVSLDRMLRQLQSGLKTGRVPHKIGYWITIVIIGSAAGSIFGGIALSRAKSKMRSIMPSIGASAYLVPNSLRIARVSDRYLHTTTETHYTPPSSSSDGSSGSSGSSYSSHYSGSSGTSHSGSGRSF